MIEFICDCGKIMRVKDEYAGRKAHCPKCGAPVIVPAHGGPAAPPFTLPAPSPAPEPERRTTTVRLDAIEAENASLRRALRRHRRHSLLTALGLLAASVLLFLNARAASSERAPLPLPTRFRDVIEADGFVVRDDQGNVRAALGAMSGIVSDADRPYGLLLFSGGKRRAMFTTVAAKGGAYLVLSDKKEDARVILHESADGTAGLELFDKNMDQRIGIDVYDDGGGNIHFDGKNAAPKIQFGAHGYGKEEAFLDFFDSHDQPHSIVPKLEP